MSLSKKHFDILSIISNKNTSLKELSSVFGICERNIRYSIDNINYYLKKMAFPIIHNQGGEASASFDNSIDDFYGEENRNNYIFSKNEREEYFFICLLFNEKTKLQDIQNYFKISTTTLNKDVKSITKYFNQYAVTVDIHNNFISLAGKEKQIRFLKMTFALKYSYFKDNQVQLMDKRYFAEKDIISILKWYFSNQPISHIISTVDFIEQELPENFEYEFKNIILLYMTITLERVTKGIIITQKNNADYLETTIQHKIVRKVLHWDADERYKYEALHLTEYFLGGYNAESYYENRFLIENFIYKLLHTVGKNLGSNLLHDALLLGDIIDYLTAAIYRVKNNLTLHPNISLDDRETKCYTEIKKVSEQFSSYLDEPLRDEEIRFISHRISQAIVDNSTKKIAMSSLIEIVSKNSPAANLDIIANEINDLYSDLIQDDRTHPCEIGLLDLLDETRIKCCGTADNIQQAIELASNLLYQQGFTKKSYLDGVLELYHSNSHVYLEPQGLLVCYGRSPHDCKNIGASAVLLKQGCVDLRNHLVRAVILISHVDNKCHLKATNQLQQLVEQHFFEQTTNISNGSDVINEMTNYLSNI